MSIDPTTLTVRQSFLQPLMELLPQCAARRECPALPDVSWLGLCLERVLHESRSGRGFLQEHGVGRAECPGVGAFFEALKSGRRLRLVEQLNRQVVQRMASAPPDRRLRHRALQDFECSAGDGHWHGAAAHDPVVQGTRMLPLKTRPFVFRSMADGDDRCAGSLTLRFR